jgi:hypothetical protein
MPLSWRQTLPSRMRSQRLRALSPRVYKASRGQRAFKHASLCVRRHSAQLQSRATSFLATKATDKGPVSTFQVHVPLVDVPGNIASASIRAMEQGRADNERHMFEQVVVPSYLYVNMLC